MPFEVRCPLVAYLVRYAFTSDALSDCWLFRGGSTRLAPRLQPFAPAARVGSMPIDYSKWDSFNCDSSGDEPPCGHSEDSDKESEARFDDVPDADGEAQCQQLVSSFRFMQKAHLLIGSSRQRSCFGPRIFRDFVSDLRDIFGW